MLFNRLTLALFYAILFGCDSGLPVITQRNLKVPVHHLLLPRCLIPYQRVRGLALIQKLLLMLKFPLCWSGHYTNNSDSSIWNRYKNLVQLDLTLRVLS